MVLDSAKKWWSGDEQKADGDGSGWNITEKLSSAASKVRDCSESAATSIGNSAKSAWNSEAIIKESTFSAANSIKTGAQAAWNSEKAATVKDYSGKVKTKVDEFNAGLMATKESAGSNMWSWWSDSKKAETKKKNDNNVEPIKKSGWRMMGSAASAVKDVSFSAVSTIGSTTKAAWNSEIAASASSAVKNGISSAGSGVKRWWNSVSEKPEDFSCEKKNQSKMSEKGWGFMGSAATVKDYTYSAASSIGDSAKDACNSEAAANTISAIKNTTASAASSIGNSAKAVWNSEFATTTSSTVKDYTYSAASSIGDSAKNVWNSEAAANTTSAIRNITAKAASSVGNSANEASSLFNRHIQAVTEPCTNNIPNPRLLRVSRRPIGVILAITAGSNMWIWWSDSKKSEAEKDKYRQREVEPTKESGWGMMGSAASAVKDVSFSAVSTIESTTKAAWNSEIAASASSAVKNGISSAGSGVKSWWNSESEKPEDFSCKKKNQSKMSEKGWGFMGSAATVKDYTYSAASSIGDSAKDAWNSETAANTISAIKNTTASAASSIGNSARAAWNSEFATTTSSAVKNGISSAGSGVKSWWNSESEKTEDFPREKKDQSEMSEKGWRFMGTTASAVKSGISSAGNGVKNWWNGQPEKTGESSGDSVRGGIAAMAKNSSEYIIKTTGRKSGILKIIDKTNYSPYGKPQWWVRYYRPRVPTPQQHININKAITSINDPHTPITPMKAKTVGALGKVAEKANDYAPILTTAAIVYESYRVGKDVKKDYDHGTTRNTIKTVATTTATYTSGSAGAYAGASIGSLLAPGLGTIFGGIAGGLMGGYYGGYYGNVASEKALDHIQWDHVTLECKACREEYTWKKYQEIEGVCCTPFESRNQDTSRYWFNKLFVNHDF